MSVSLSETTVEPLQGYNAIVVTWEYGINAEGVRINFSKVRDMLDDSPGTLHVVINTLNSPNFPLMTTIQAALAEVLSHAQLGTCVIVGNTGLSRILAKTLQDMSRERTIPWVDSLNNALAFLKRQQAG